MNDEDRLKYDQEIIYAIKDNVRPDCRSRNERVRAVLTQFASNAINSLNDPWNETSVEDAKWWVAGMAYVLEILGKPRIPQGDRIC